MYARYMVTGPNFGVLLSNAKEEAKKLFKGYLGGKIYVVLLEISPEHTTRNGIGASSISRWEAEVIAGEEDELPLSDVGKQNLYMVDLLQSAEG